MVTHVEEVKLEKVKGISVLEGYKAGQNLDIV
jgi:hypothetical protein